MKKTKQFVKMGVAGFMFFTLFLTGNFNVRAEGVEDVASINGKGYSTLKAAIAARQDGDTILLLQNTSLTAKTDGDIREGVGTILNLNGKGVLGANGNSTFRVVDNKDVKIHNGSITADDTTYCTLIVADAKLFLEEVILENKMANGNSIKVLQYGNVTIKNVTSTSHLGGGIEAAGGTVNISNSTFVQKGFYDWNSQIVAASGGDGVVNVYDGFVGISENYGAYIFNSGGTINIYGGNFSAEKAVLKVDKNTSEFEYGGPSTMNVSGGNFTGPIQVQEGAILNVSGGTFLNSGLTKDKFSKYVDLDKYKVIEKDGSYTVVPKIESITLSQSTVRVESGRETQLTASATPMESSEKITWTSSDPSIATVDDNGVIMGKAVGKVSITAEEDGKSATCEVQVYKIEKPVLPTPPVNNGKDTTIEVNEKTTEVLTDTIKDIVNNVEEATGISSGTKIALKEAIAQGKQISVEAKTEKVDAKKVDTTIVKKIEKVIAKDAKIGQYFDLSMMIQADGSDLGTMNELSSKASFTVSVPTDLTKEGRTFYMVRIHDGVAEKIAGKLEGNEFTFESDKFSLFALVYEDAKPSDKEETENKKYATVDTGDSTNKDVLYNLLSLSVLAMGVLVFKKKSSI